MLDWYLSTLIPIGLIARAPHGRHWIASIARIDGFERTRVSRATSPTACIAHRDLAGHPPVKHRGWRDVTEQPDLPGRREESRGKCATTSSIRNADASLRSPVRNWMCRAVRAKARNIAERVESGSHPLLARSLFLFLSKGMRDSGAEGGTTGGWGDQREASLRFSGIHIGHVRGFCALVPQ